MKVHSFVRYNTSRLLKIGPSTTNAVPKVTKFIYFLFAPTLIYRDDYPRTTHIRWNFVIVSFFEIIITIFYISFVIERFLMPPYEDFCLKKYPWSDIVLSIFVNAFAGILFLLLIFYCVLHATQNIFAELLTFADRMFYSDWWTSNTLPRWYRTWNVVVHDWLYTYIYKDLVEIVIPNRKLLAKFMVFFISAILHEIMLIFILDIFCPILFLEFISIGFIFYFIRGPKHSVSNILMLYGIAQGAGIQLSVYCLEFYARYNFPIENKSVWDFFILRSLACNCIK